MVFRAGEQARRREGAAYGGEAGRSQAGATGRGQRRHSLGQGVGGDDDAAAPVVRGGDDRARIGAAEADMGDVDVVA